MFKNVLQRAEDSHWWSHTLPANIDEQVQPIFDMHIKNPEKIVAAVLHKRIALFFGEQNTIDAHYVDVFVTFVSANCNDFDSVCLNMSLMEDEATQTADKHNEFLSYTLGVFDKNFDNATELNADSCCTNRSIVIKLRKLLIVCSSYRF